MILINNFANIRADYENVDEHFNIIKPKIPNQTQYTLETTVPIDNGKCANCMHVCLHDVTVTDTEERKNDKIMMLPWLDIYL